VCVGRAPRRPASPLFPSPTLFRSRAGHTPFVDGWRGGPGVDGDDRGGPPWIEGAPWSQARGWTQLRRSPGSSTVRFRPLAVLVRSEEHTSELQSRENLVCRLLLEK